MWDKIKQFFLWLFKSNPEAPLIVVEEPSQPLPEVLVVVEEEEGPPSSPGTTVIEVNVGAILAEQEKEPVPDELTTNFHIREFACHDGTGVPPELRPNVFELAQNLQVLRDHLGKAVRVVSGYRHSAYNKKIGGAKYSQHMGARAADIKVKGLGSDKLAAVIIGLIKEGKMKQGGVGIYPTFVHYDVRGTAARWSGSRKKN